MENSRDISVGDLIYGSDSYFGQVTRVGGSVVEFTTVGMTGASDSYIEINYDDLVELRDSNSLKKGAFYRITDYETTTVEEETRSAGHLFDIIVQALDEKTISENAHACLHEGDTYFANYKLEAWELKYCLDNDTNRFAWADEVNGKGVIYYMKDENNNEVSYDFKNIQFKRELFDNNEEGITFVDIYFYTFSAYSYELATGVQSDIEDATIITKQERIDDYYNRCYSNVIKPLYAEYYTGTIDVPIWGLNNSIFVNKYSSSLYFQCEFNTFGFNFNNNTIGNNFINNTIGDNSAHNTIGDDSGYNVIGNSFSNNTIGNSFHSNTIGSDFYGNTLGNDFSNNTISSDFFSNIIGNSFYSNTIGSDFYSNRISSRFQYSIVEDNVRYIQLTDQVFQNNTIKYLHLKSGLIGASSKNRLDLYYSGLYNREYPTTFEIIANGNVISSYHATPLTRAGKIKATRTTANWSNI